MTAVFLSGSSIESRVVTLVVVTDESAEAGNDGAGGTGGTGWSTRGGGAHSGSSMKENGFLTYSEQHVAQKVVQIFSDVHC